MKRKVIFIQISFCFIYILASILFAPNASANLWQGLHDCAIYEGGWQVHTNTQSSSYDKLPVFFYPEDDEQTISISKTLSNISDGDCIGFFTFEQQVLITIDGEEIYKFAPPSYIQSQTPGNKWHFIPLNADDTGKNLTIQLHQCYNEGRVTIPTMYYGTQAGITLNYLSLALPRISLSIATIFIGFLLGIFHLLKRNSTLVGDSIKWLAWFAIFRGLWSFIESNTYSFFFSRLLLISQFSYMILKIAVVIYLQFLNETFHNGKNHVLHTLGIISIVEFFVSFTLQFFGFADYANTVFITHILMLIAGVYTSVNVVHTFHKQHKKGGILSSNHRYTNLAQLICTLIVILTVMIDMVRYYAANSPDVARFSRIGDIIYVLLMSFSIFMDFIYLLKMGQKASLIQEEASTDPMTKLLNRATFEKDLARFNTKLWLNRSIIILDLNNLKLFNDKKGHDAGDIYITTAGSIIHKVFSPYGRVYRIGGDEFCVISKSLTHKKFLELRTIMEEEINSKNDTNDTIPMRISAGYATYDATLDQTLNDTMKRADKEMYYRKEELKK